MLDCKPKVKIHFEFNVQSGLRGQSSHKESIST